MKHPHSREDLRILSTMRALFFIHAVPMANHLDQRKMSSSFGCSCPIESVRISPRLFFFHSVTNLHTILRYSCFQSIQHCLFLFLFISNTIQWKTQFNLNKVCFFIHAKSSLYNKLLPIFILTSFSLN